jgi:DNA-binding TFAR19-related protein (PDSD5 family)
MLSRALLAEPMNAVAANALGNIALTRRDSASLAEKYLQRAVAGVPGISLAY